MSRIGVDQHRPGLRCLGAVRITSLQEARLPMLTRMQLLARMLMQLLLREPLAMLS